MLLPSICLDTTTVTTTVTIESTPPPSAVVAPAPPPPAVIAPPALVAPSIVAPSIVAVAPPPPRAIALHPVLLSVAAGSGLGFDTKDHCEDLQCAALAIDVGVSIHRGFYAVLSAQLWDSPEHPGTARHHAETLGLRMQGTRAWAEAGLGIGSRRTEYGFIFDSAYTYMSSGLDLAASVAVGYNPLVRRAYALGVQARASATPDVEHTLVSALLLGITWY